MKDLNKKERTDIFKKIGPNVAGEMSKSLQTLTKEKIKIEFTKVQTFDQSTLFVDVGEKCFGSFVSFKSEKDNLEGIVVAVFPLSSTKTLIELLLKRHFRRLNKESIDHEMKLSAFKETVNILLLTYITGVANALKLKLEIDLPKFASFRNIKFINSAFLRKHLKFDSLVSVGQLRITHYSPSMPSIKGGLLSCFSYTF